MQYRKWRGISLVLWCAMAMMAAGNADLQVTLRSSDANPAARASYLRSETLEIRIGLILTNAPARDGQRLTGKVGLVGERDQLCHEEPFAMALTGPGTNECIVRIPLRALRRGEYRVTVQGRTGTNDYQSTVPVWICAAPERKGFVMALLEEQRRDGVALETHLQRLHELGMTGVMSYQVAAPFLDRCLWYGLNSMSISHGDARSGGFQGGPEAIARLNASGQPFLQFGAGGQRGRWGISSLDWQEAAARSLVKTIAGYMAYPSYDPRICTSDDYFMWTGLDYNSNNVIRFRQKYSIDPPRPPEAMAADFPATVARVKGVIPDNDPWVLWLEFLSRDVLGHYNGLLAQAAAKASGGQGRIGPVCGGGNDAMGITPLIDMGSGQWPPFNFGPDRFSLICYYNYNFYLYPALAQVWWAELARMGNRDMDAWLMPETMDPRLSCHLQNWYLYLASGLDGLVYFLYERDTPASEEAFRRVGPLARRYRHLLGALAPAPRNIGLLMPFENGCFRAAYPADAAYAFCNLAMAHAEVEPVDAGELSERMNQYKVILLHDIDWLNESHAQLLAQFQARGGIVLADSLTELKLPGIRPVDFPFGEASRAQGYGQTNRIAQVRNALAPWTQPWADTDNSSLLLRHFQLHGVDYLWVVHLMNREEDALHIPPPGENGRGVPLRPEFKDFDQREIPATVTVSTTDAFAVYDVLKGTALQGVQHEGGRLRIPLHLGMWQGSLLAFYPHAIDAMRVRADRKVRAGHELELHVTVLGGKRPLAASLPLEVTVIDPAGNANQEYSHSALANTGEYRWRIPFAGNDTPGTWRILVRELSSGIEQATEVQLLAPR